MSTPFSEVIRNLYMYVGNVSEEQLPFPTAVHNARTALKKRLVDLQLSDEQHLLVSFDLYPDGGKTYDITESNFGEAVLIQYSVDGINFTGNIQVVNKANLYLSQGDSVLKASIYGNPKVLEFSIIPSPSIQAFRVYYEPHEALNPRISTSIDINNTAFLTLISIDGALLSLDDVAGVDKEYLAAKKVTLRIEKQEWETRWTKWLEKPTVQGVVKKRLFNSRRRR